MSSDLWQEEVKGSLRLGIKALIIREAIAPPKPEPEAAIPVAKPLRFKKN